MNERLLELKKKVDHLDELVVERDEAYKEYLRDVEENRTEFMKESYSEVQQQISDEIKIEHHVLDQDEINDRIDDIFSGKCRGLKSYLRYMKLKRDIVLINQMKLAMSRQQ